MEPAEAEVLWANLRDALANVEECIKAIIAAKAWIPLGFETFAQAWDARMAGVALSNSIKPYVIYAMLDERVPVEDIAGITGWGRDQVSRAGEDHRLGIPVAGATVVRRHVRRAPGERRTVHVTFDADEIAWLRQTAARCGRELQEEARRAIVKHFEALDARTPIRRGA